MKRRLKIVLISILAFILIGCNKIPKQAKEFEDNINNKNYEFAYNIYDKNRKNSDFLNLVDTMLQKKIDELRKSMNEETLVSDKAFIELVIRIKGEDFVNDILIKIQELEKENNELSKGVNYLENKQYYLAIYEFEKINELSNSFDTAQEYIKNNIDNARNEKINNAKKMYNNKQFDIALKELEDIKSILNNDIEIENLIKSYILEKNNYEKELQAKKTEQLEEEKKQKESNNNIEATNNSDVKYNRYYNTRYKFSIDYPSDLIEQPAPTNNNGREFKNEDNTVSLVASGYNNVLYKTIEDDYNETINTLDRVIYKSLSERSYVISWEEENKIFYSCKIFGDGSINQFTFRYPKSKANEYNKVVENVYNSFTPGDLSLAY